VIIGYWRRRNVTTKGTKDTKASEIDIFESLNFVLFVTFVVPYLLSFWLRLCRAGTFVVKQGGRRYADCFEVI
jgi:hypothetical protein